LSISSQFRLTQRQKNRSRSVCPAVSIDPMLVRRID
jgi:hypothetical protein